MNVASAQLLRSQGFPLPRGSKLYAILNLNLLNSTDTNLICHCRNEKAIFEMIMSIDQVNYSNSLIID